MSELGLGIPVYEFDSWFSFVFDDYFLVDLDWRGFAVWEGLLESVWRREVCVYFGRELEVVICKVVCCHLLNSLLNRTVESLSLETTRSDHDQVESTRESRSA